MKTSSDNAIGISEKGIETECKGVLVKGEEVQRDVYVDCKPV